MKIAGVVLAGGASRRMGQNKALLTCREQTFLDGLTTTLSLGGCNPVLAVVSEPVAPVRENCRLDQVRLVINPDPSRGQISSLRVALQALSDAEGLVVLLVDQGEVEVETVRRVVEALGQAPVVVASCQGQPGHPVAFSSGVFDALVSDEADHGANQVVESFRAAGRVMEVEVDDPGVIRNLNTPDQYQAFLDESAISRG